jgi:hypothetical protein
MVRFSGVPHNEHGGAAKRRRGISLPAFKFMYLSNFWTRDAM